MAFAFDTLGYAKKLRNAGVPQDQAEAHAEAAREFVMAELVTRYDLETARSDLENRIAAVRTDLEVLRREVESSIAAVRNEINVLRREVESSIAAVRNEIDVLRREVESAIDRLSLRITVRMGVMLAAAIAILATINRL